MQDASEMVKRKSLISDTCPSARSLDVIGDWWSLLIVRDAFDGLTRFGEFQKSLGIAKNILALRLRTLVERGILETRPTEGTPSRDEYRLTEMGQGLFPVMVALRQWGESYLFEPDEKRSRLLARDTGRRIILEVKTEDGKLVGSSDTVIEKVPDDGGP